MGFPLNTNYDDFALSTDHGNRTGFFTSNRPGGRGTDDIYSFRFNYLLIVGTLKQQKDNVLIPNAEIELYDLDGNLVSRSISDEQGRFHLDVGLEGDYQIIAKKEGYTMDEAYALSTLKIPNPVDSVEIFLWKHRLFAEGKIYSNEEEIVMSDVLVRILNQTDGTVDSLITDAEGKYRFILQSEKNYKIIASKQYYLPDEVEINTINIEEGDILNDLVLEEEYIDKSVVFFDYDKSKIRSDGVYELKRMLKILKRNPEDIIVISAHADARGTHEYNQRLSNQRAKAAKDYFLKNEIIESRIIARGFGEELHINRCSNGIDCHEIEHSKNRRAELKVEKPN